MSSFIDSLDLEVSTSSLNPVPGLESTPDSPEQAINALSDQDVRNGPYTMASDRRPGEGLVVGPLARTETGQAGVFVWCRFRPGVNKQFPTRASMVTVPVMGGLDPMTWRQRLVTEARRINTEGPVHHRRQGPIHFERVRDVLDFDQVPVALVELFGADGHAWAKLCEQWIDHIDAQNQKES